MKRTYIKDIKHDEKVKISGFVENFRDSKKMAFIVVKDITGKLQVTVEKENMPELAAKLEGLTPDSVITFTGTVIASEYVKLNNQEMIPDDVVIESIAEALPIARKDIPATKKKQAVERSSIDQRIDYRWIDLRTDENQLMFKVQTCMVNAMREFLIEKDLNK
jgi:aspartyl-tRNA synthetase